MVSSSRSRVLSTTVVLSFLLGGCTFDEVSLQGLECPCAEGWVCRDEVCVRAEEAVDGGTGAPDLGEPDAAVADAGTDDPGPEDAGLEDDAAIAEMGRKFRDTVLAQGGSRHPMEVFRDFRGREPSTDALKRHTGLV